MMYFLLHALTPPPVPVTLVRWGMLSPAPMVAPPMVAGYGFYLHYSEYIVGAGPGRF